MKILKGYSEYQRSGIYCLFNLYNEKFYIGSSVNISKRVWEHFYALKKDNHYNNYLQRAFNKCPNYFIGFVLEDVEIDSLLDREQYWIDRLEAYNPEIGYNLSPSASGTYGYKHTKETLKKMSEIKTGENHHNFGKPLPELTRKRIGEGNKGKIRTDDTKQKLRDINLGKVLSEDTKTKISESMRNKQWTDEQLKKMANSKAKKVFQYDLNSKLINIFNSVAEASRQLNISKQQIAKVCRGEKSNYKGYVWNYDH